MKRAHVGYSWGFVPKKTLTFESLSDPLIPQGNMELGDVKMTVLLLNKHT